MQDSKKRKIIEDCNKTFSSQAVSREMVLEGQMVPTYFVAMVTSAFHRFESLLLTVDKRSAENETRIECLDEKLANMKRIFTNAGSQAERRLEEVERHLHALTMNVERLQREVSQVALLTKELTDYM